MRTGAWVVNADGEYPYAPATGDIPEEPGNSPAEAPAPPSISRNRFVPRQSLKTPYNVISYNSLSESLKEINKEIPCTMVKFSGNYYAIASNVSLESEYYALYCNSKDQPFVAVDDRSVTNVDFDYIYNDNSTNVDNSQHLTVEDMKILDITNNTMNLVDDKGQTTNYTIESLTYDASTKNYTANVYNQTFNTTNNYYEYNYYTFNISYTYNNTYVTYIGSNADYQEPYEYYYELPDGRSSADLTAEDVAGLSFQFYDVINYEKSATDTSLRALYHFDGDTDDSSYFSTQTAFTWNKGASITYMDSSAFNGCLYMDEQEHDFTVTLPSNIGSGDFTLQWRYYQNSATTTEHNENYVMFGNTKLLGWSEKNFYRMGTTQMYPLSLGTWQELALIRYNGILYFYHNGLKVGSLSNSSVFEDTLTFHLGASSRAYSMLDEMRFVNFAVAEGTNSYTCTSVPYDTNGVLVLPGGALPIADEYWEFDTTIDPTYSLDMTTGYLTTFTGSNWSSFTPSGFYCLDDSVGVYDGFATLRGGSSSSSGQMRLRNYYDYDEKVTIQNLSLSGSGVGVYLDRTRWTNPSTDPMIGDYTFNLVCRDGSSYSFTCNIPSAFGDYSYAKSFNWGTMTYYRYKASVGGPSFALHSILFDVSPGKSLDVVYLEAVPGTSPNTGHKLVTCVYNPNELQANTAAVQSDIPVKGYTVGGVRPTFPARGDVWFPVEGSRISGVQIYNGRAWEQTNARWWTGKRWIPIYAFDLITLEDMWDVAGEGGSEVTPPITSDYGFWNWWQKEWLDFRVFLAKVFSIEGGGIGGGSGGGGGGGSFWDPIKDAITNGLATLIEALFDIVTEVLKKLISLVTDLLSFIFNFFTDTVWGGITSFFSAITDGSLFDFFRQTETIIDESGNEVERTTTALPEGIAGVFVFFSGVILLLPWELRSMLFFGIASLVLLSVFKLVKS